MNRRYREMLMHSAFDTLSSQRWFKTFSLLAFGIALAGIVSILTGGWQVGVFIISGVALVFVMTYLVWKASVVKRINAMPEEEARSLLDIHRFEKCRDCGKPTSKAGNYTNMILCGIDDPKEFDEMYGMMCAEHAEESTAKIMAERNLDEADFQRANEAALRQMFAELP